MIKGLCSETLETLRTLAFAPENQAKRARSGSLPSLLKSSSQESAITGEKGEKRHKLVKLKNLKNGGTTVRNDHGDYEYYYDPLETGNNPYTTRCESGDKGYSVELKMQSGRSKIVAIPDLPTQYCETTSSHRGSSTTHLFESSSTSALPSVAAAEQGITNGGVAVCGSVVIRIKDSRRPLKLQQQVVSLKCFVEEYACFVDTSKKHPSKQIKLLKKNDDDIPYLLPVKELRLDLTRMVRNQVLCGGSTYELPFTFTLKPHEFPASVRTYFGTTTYRVESVTKVGGCGAGGGGGGGGGGTAPAPVADTCFLTDELSLKRVLPTTSDIKYESVQMQGDWNGELEYDLFVSNKMIELDCPFDVHLRLMRSSPKSRVRFHSLTVSLSQATSIPCVNSRTAKNLPTSYLKKNEVEIYRKALRGPQSGGSACGAAAGEDDHHRGEEEEAEEDVELQLHRLTNLRVAGSSSNTTWLRPFYCELSANCTERARLKITHMLNVRLIVTNAATADRSPAANEGHMTYLTFKVPVLLVDSDMTMNLWLPPYSPDGPPGYDEALGVGGATTAGGTRGGRKGSGSYRQHKQQQPLLSVSSSNLPKYDSIA